LSAARRYDFLVHATQTASTPQSTPLLAPWLRLGGAGVCMQFELPLAALLIARLPDASMQMLAFGSLAYPLAVVAESPSYMLTSLGTVKGMHGGAFGRMLRFSVMVAMLLAGALGMVAFTPLFDMLAANVMRVPATTVPEARLALQVRRLHRATPAQEAQTCPEPWVDLVWFYAPLAVTALIDTTWEMLVIIGVSRSALPLESLGCGPWCTAS
jgi:hypothetical protein